MTLGRPRKTHLSQAEYGRLLEVIGRRHRGQTWTEIAAAMGWKSRQSAHNWTKIASRIAQPREKEIGRVE